MNIEHWIANRSVTSGSGRRSEVFNPATGQVTAHVVGSDQVKLSPGAGMSISHLAATAHVEELESWGLIGESAGAQPCRVRGIQMAVAGRESVDTGIWECSPGRFRRQVTSGEVMHFLVGRCTFTPDEGTPVDIAAGDTLLMSPNTTGIWEIHETVRKLYVMV